MKTIGFLSALALSLAGCSGSSSCGSGTITIDATFANGAEQADTLTVNVSVDGVLTDTTTVQHTPGTTSAPLSISFADGYPVGHDVTIGIVAAVGTSELASGTLDYPSIGKACITASLALVETHTDMSVPPVDMDNSEDM